MKYDGMVDVLRKTFRKEGFRGLYKVGGRLLGIGLGWVLWG